MLIRNNFAFGAKHDNDDDDDDKGTLHTDIIDAGAGGRAIFLDRSFSSVSTCSLEMGEGSFKHSEAADVGDEDDDDDDEDSAARGGSTVAAASVHLIFSRCWSFSSSSLSLK